MTGPWVRVPPTVGEGISGGERPRDADAIAALSASSRVTGRADSQTLEHENDDVEDLPKADIGACGSGRQESAMTGP